MSKQSDRAVRRPYSEPFLVEYGALTELTRAANGSGGEEGTMSKLNNAGNTVVSCKKGNAQQGKKACSL